MSFEIFSQSAFSSCGGDVVSFGKGSVSYSIGLLDYTNFSAANGTISSGVQQPFVNNATVETIDEQLLDNSFKDFKVTPNPTKDKVTVSFPLLGSFIYVLTDVDGKIFDQGVLVDKMDLSLLNYQSGTYLLRIFSEQNDGFFTVEKIIKE